MIFRIQNRFNLNPDLYRSAVYEDARHYIIQRKLNATDKRLNKFLQDNYKIDLKLICLCLLKAATFTLDQNSNIIVYFKNDKDDKLATLITYGNGIILGSNILRIAFGK